MIKLVQVALALRSEHMRCQELAEALRQETSWINQEALGHQLQTHLNIWRDLLSEYDQLSKDYAYDTPDEVYILHNLNKLVDDYRHAR